MAVVTQTSKSVAGSLAPGNILLATSGDTLVYTSGLNQELWLFNTDVSPIVVTVNGSGGTTVTLPNTGGVTASVTAGVALSVAAGDYRVVNLDKISAYCQGTVAITAATGAKIAAAITY